MSAADPSRTRHPRRRLLPTAVAVAAPAVPVAAAPTAASTPTATASPSAAVPGPQSSYGLDDPTQPAASAKAAAKSLPYRLVALPVAAAI